MLILVSLVYVSEINTSELTEREVLLSVFIVVADRVSELESDSSDASVVLAPQPHNRTPNKKGVREFKKLFIEGNYDL
jgi:hypothetical protein